MSPSIHKLLLHPVQAQNHLQYPTGVLSESAGELWHRMRKQIRKESTRKISRKATMEDLLHRCLDQSDPVVSEIARKWILHFRDHKPALPDEAVRLLSLGNEEDDESDEDDDGDDNGNDNNNNDVSNESTHSTDDSSSDDESDNDGSSKPSKIARKDVSASDSEEVTSAGMMQNDKEEIEAKNCTVEVEEDLWEGDFNENDPDFEREEEYLYEYADGD